QRRGGSAPTPRKAKQPVVESNLNNKKQALLFIVLNQVLLRFANEFESAKFEFIKNDKQRFFPLILTMIYSM
ncbi:hypothetical protein ACTXGU_10725, partial [Niallia sp. 01092]|uniref:hypothetical protein n=1 Tax=Niallia sp. 01092 TaxID=3457759 RepID=UPI003FD517B6